MDFLWTRVDSIKRHSIAGFLNGQGTAADNLEVPEAEQAAIETDDIARAMVSRGLRCPAVNCLPTPPVGGKADIVPTCLNVRL